MISVKGRWTFITGASRGVGYQTTIFMAKQGANLILHSRTLEHTQKLLNEVKALGVEAYAVAAELSEPDRISPIPAGAARTSVGPMLPMQLRVLFPVSQWVLLLMTKKADVF